MNPPSHLALRTSKWHFRRRLPGSSHVIQIPLGTTDRERASRIAARLADGMDAMLEKLLIDREEIPAEMLATYVDFCTRRIALELTRMRRRERTRGDAPADAAIRTEIRRKVISFLAEDGVTIDFPAHRVREFATPEELEIAMEIHSHECLWVQKSIKAPHYKYAASLILGTSEKSTGQLAQLKEGYIQAKVSAFDSVYPPPAERVIVGSTDGEVPPSAPVPPQVAAPISPVGHIILTDGLMLHDGPLTHEILDAQFAIAKNSEEDLDRSPKTEPFSFDIAGVCERGIKRDIDKGKIDDETADSRRSSVKLFMFITGVQLITEVEQYHLAIFIKTMKYLRKNFNKSSRDRKKRLPEVLAEAKLLPPEEIGRDPGTVNRHLEVMGALVTYARTTEYIPVDRDIDTSQLRAVELKRARDKRDAFRRDEVVTLFKHHIWHGCKNETRRQDPGSLVQKDGLYWIPLIVHYTGARLEEIAGLPVEAVMQQGNNWGFDIRPHEERRLKNLQSERLIPVHEHLIELGLIDHRDRMLDRKEHFLFPELRPKSSKIPFHKPIMYNWNNARVMQLKESAKRLTMHSLRHYVNITLKSNKSIEKSVRLDILGHAAVDLNEEVYTAGASFSEKSDAINSIPRAF